MNTLRIQLRKDQATNWSSVNPILAEAELGVETDTSRIKVGNGIDTWNNLDYFGGSEVDPASVINVETLGVSSTLDPNKVYILNGLANYTLTLPSAVGNKDNVISLYKQFNSSDRQKIILVTSNSESIESKLGQLSEISFRLQGEYISLVSDGSNWIVQGDSGYLNQTITVKNENEFLLGIDKLNDLGGGDILIGSTITITEPREVTLNNITIKSTGSNNKRIIFDGYERHLLINGDFNFQDIRLTGVSNTSNFTHNILRVNNGFLNGIFRNVTFQNIIGDNSEPEGKGVITFVGPNSGGNNLTIESCDWFPEKTGDFEIKLEVDSSGNNLVSFFNLFAYGIKRFFTNFKLSCEADHTNWNAYSDSTSVFTGKFFNVYSIINRGLIEQQSPYDKAYTQDDILILSENLNSLKKIKAGDFLASFDAQDTGKIWLNEIDTEYIVTSSKVTPFSTIQLTVESPDGAQNLPSIAIKEVTLGQFTIVMDNAPNSPYYLIHWYSTPSNNFDNNPQPLGDYNATIDLDTEYQTIQGYGANVAYTTQDISSSDYLKQLFFGSTNENCLGLSFVRARINPNGVPTSSDLDAWNWIDNMNLNPWAWPESWEWKTCEVASKDYGVPTLLTQWSVPAYMKENTTADPYKGGNIRSGNGASGQPFYYELAVFQSKVVKQFVNKGIIVSSLSPINEPNGSSDNESTFFSDSELKTYIENYLKPEMINLGLQDVLISAPSSIDWNNDNSKGIESYTNTINSTTVDIVEGHQYDWSYELFSNSTWIELNAPTINKPIWQTEVSDAFNNQTYPINSIQHAIWFARNIHMHMEMGTVGWLFWWLRPVAGEENFSTNEALLSDRGETPTISKTGYAIAQWSKFIKPGYKKVNLNLDIINSQAQVTNSGLYSSCYKNSELDQVVIVIINDTDQSEDILFDLTIEKDYVNVPYITDSTRSTVKLTPSPCYQGKFSYSIIPMSIITFVLDPL